MMSKLGGQRHRPRRELGRAQRDGVRVAHALARDQSGLVLLREPLKCVSSVTEEPNLPFFKIHLKLQYPHVARGYCWGREEHGRERGSTLESQGGGQKCDRNHLFHFRCSRSNIKKGIREANFSDIFNLTHYIKNSTISTYNQ